MFLLTNIYLAIYTYYRTFWIAWNIYYWSNNLKKYYIYFKYLLQNHGIL